MQNKAILGKEASPCDSARVYEGDGWVVGMSLPTQQKATLTRPFKVFINQEP